MAASAASKKAISNRQVIIERRHRQYARACKLCRNGQKIGYYPSRAVISGHAVWMHDGVLTCKAWELREKHWQEDNPSQ